MQSSKIFSIFLIIALFSGFSIFEYIRKSENSVLNIITPTEIEVDLNKNNSLDDGETICINNLQTFTSNLNKNQDELTKLKKISNVDAIKLGYLTDELAENILSDKKVKLKFSGKQNPTCRYADVYINNENYSNILKNSGLGFDKNGNTDDKTYLKQLEKARKLKLIILNHKSNKYHTLECKYGLIAHDIVIIPEKQKPSDAKPCKYCHIKKDKKHFKQNKTLKNEIQTYPLAISNGSIKMYLTDLTTTLKPNNKCNSLVCKELLNQINNSKTSIDIAIYGWDSNPQIYNALLRAKARGVKIQMVYDTSSKSYYPELKNFVKLADKRATDLPKELMHNKFMIFDNSRIVTGSMNFSSTGLSGFNTNCIFFINSKEISNIYKKEFEQMLSGKFHQSKSIISHKTFILGPTRVTPLFSPKDKIITNNIIPIINNAKDYIYIPTFIITHQAMFNALVNAKKRGVKVKIIADATNTNATKSKIELLRNAKIPVKVENYAGKVHSKSIIIDDKYIVAGSMNFSNSGENRNDENVLIIEDLRLAKYYKGFFEYLWKKIPDKYLQHNVRAESKYSIGSCSDGIDNNFDGKIDKNDIGCQ